MLWLLTRKILQKNKLQLRRDSLIFWTCLCCHREQEAAFVKVVAWGGQDNLDVETRIRREQSVESFALVKGVAGVKMPRPKGKQQMETDQAGQSIINLFVKLQLPRRLELEIILF